jgi:ribonuclease P protein component
MIPYINRFHGHNSLRYVYSHGKATRSHIVTIKHVVNAHRKNSRIAVVVSKKIMKSAVRRNRIRRRLYEYMRLHLPQFAKTFDVVLIVSSAEVLAMPSSELTAHLDSLLEQASLLKELKTPKN